MICLGFALAGVVGTSGPVLARPSGSFSSATETAARAGRQGYQYLSPVPGSRYVTRATAIAIRRGEALDPASLDATRLVVTGARSGRHAGSLRLSTDGRTLVFQPAREFAAGEGVQVELQRGFRTTRGAPLPPITFDFTVSTGHDVRGGRVERLMSEIAASGAAGLAGAADRAAQNGTRDRLDDDLPVGYRGVNVMLSNDPAPGTLFLSPFSGGFQTEPGRLLIVDNTGQPLFYRAVPSVVFDFKRQPNGLLTYFCDDRYFVMDSSGAAVDTFEMGNGYFTDEHEFQMLPDGHVLMMAYDTQPVGMDTVVAGGDPTAFVIGLVLQEQDAEHNVVFQWRSWDHFQITDLVECSQSLTGHVIDYVHGNAIELDTDGNLLVSSRHLNEITAIDRQTGDVLWRFGSNAKNNDFTFANDPRGFAHQHDIRRQPNGNLTLFDNGNCLLPPYSRLLEYQLDRLTWTATLVREYRHTPDIFGPFMGNQQVHEDRSVTSSWGGSAFDPKVTEEHADGSPALELGFGSPVVWTYRAFRFPWQTSAFGAPESIDFGVASVGEAPVIDLPITNAQTTDVTLTHFVNTNPHFQLMTPLPVTIGAGATVPLQVSFTPDSLGPVNGTLYLRSVSDSLMNARSIALTGTGISQALYLDDAVQYEGSELPEAMLFTLRLAKPAEQEVTVEYNTVDFSATVADSDYIATSGTATIPLGDSTVTLSVAVLADYRAEGDDQFELRLHDATHAVIVDGLAMGVILSDDGPTSVDGGAAALRFALHAPQPNPARGTVRFAYDLPAASRVRLEIFDVRGRLVATLVDGAVPAGRWTAAWSPPAGERRAAGIYFARLRAGGASAMRKLVVAN